VTQHLSDAAVDTPAPSQREVVLRLDSLEKSYPGVHVLKNVSLEVRRGEIHALVGENGAGKSTLVGVAAGSVPADSGSIEIGGEIAESPDTKWCRDHGLAIVYQEPALLPDLTVAENMRLGMPEASRPKVGEQVSWAKGILSEWAEVARIDPNEFVRHLRPDARFVVEIARAVAENPKVLILDEPTEHLLPAAVEELFKLISRVIERGAAVVYISHKIHEVKRISTTVSVLRDGVMEGTFPAGEMTEQDIVSLVVGHRIERAANRHRPPDENQPVRLNVSGLAGRGFADVDLQVHRGEIVGLAGVEGQGQRDIIRALAGLERSTGEVTLDEKPIRRSSIPAAMNGGIVYLPHDRHNEGVLPRLSLRDNAALGSIKQFASLGVISNRRERKVVGEQLRAVNVKATSADATIDSLSGGNQQKVVLSRVLLGHPEVLLADEPTQGLDVGARSEIYTILRAAADSGMSIVVLSSSAEELEELCDRVVVISRGRPVKELTGTEISEREITGAALLATGSRASAEAQRKGRPAWARVADNDLTPGGVLLVATLVLGLVAALHSPFYLTQRNFSLMLPSIAILGFFALAQQLVMMVGGIDLSVGPLAGFLVVLGSFVLSAYRSPLGIFLGLSVVVLAAIGVGLLNWILATLVGITPFIATLVTYTALQGVSFLLRPLPGGTIDPNFLANVTQTIGFIPVMFVVVLVGALLLEFTLRRSLFGVRLRAFGSNQTVAQRVGVKGGRAALVGYVGCSLLVVPAAVLLMAQAGTGNPTIGDTYTLASIGAVVLGGASIFGGRGSFIGALLGAVLVIQANTVVQFLGLQLYWQQWLLGGLTVVAAAFYSKTRALSAGGA
jgi:ribose transport system ATP-binding protein